jgi:hypothetical protein
MGKQKLRVQTWQSEKQKKATKAAFTCALALFHRRHVFRSCLTDIQERRMLVSVSLPQLENSLSSF